MYAKLFSFRSKIFLIRKLLFPNPESKKQFDLKGLTSPYQEISLSQD